MPSFIVVVALWVGTNIGRGVPEEPPIIPENTFVSKGLAAPWGLTQVLERTDFFRPYRQMAAVRVAQKVPEKGLAALLHGIEELVVVLGGAQLVQQEFG